MHIPTPAITLQSFQCRGTRTGVSRDIQWGRSRFSPPVLEPVAVRLEVLSVALDLRQALRKSA